MPRLRSLLAAGLLAGLTACIGSNDSAVPTGPRPSAAFSASVASGDSTKELSSVCQAYQTELQQLRAAVAANPTDEVAQEDLAAMQVRFTDACE
jgi:hypothetical protein